MLPELKAYAETIDLPPTSYQALAVRYVIALNERGQLISTTPLDTADPAGKKTDRGTRMLMPHVLKGSGIVPRLLADSADYALGLARDDTERQKALAQQRHAAFRALVERCAERTRAPEVIAVRDFLAGDPLAQITLPERFDQGANITFRVGECFPADLPSVREFWAEEDDPTRLANGEKQEMQCLICGQVRPALRLIPWKVKGIRGGQTSGTSIISANADAFLSYGLEQSFIAPTCRECAEKFSLGLNALLADERTRLYVGDTTFAFWTREPVGFSAYDFFANPDPAEVKALIESARRGRTPTKIDATRFYCLAFSPSGGRVAVRDWIDTTVGEVRDNLRDWFQGQALLTPSGEMARPQSIFALAAATVRDVSKDLSPLTPRILLHAALTGAPLPIGMLYQAVRRNRAEQGVNTPRACLIKTVLASRQRDKEDRMVQLDTQNTSPAYLCGRLLAVLEQVQDQAIPGAKAGIVDRFYGTASSAPASVFGRLLRGAQPHLGKLQRDRPGAYYALQSRLEEVQAGLKGFPKTLTLEEQGVFALGYYHQRAHDRAMAIKAGRDKERASAGEKDEAEETAMTDEAQKEEN